MAPGDYFAINTPPAVYANLHFQGQQLATVNVPHIETQVGETVVGRTGGAVSLAVGMAQIFSALPGMSGLMSYWYHFAIMFEALFILTTIDTGTRVGRFLVQEFFGRFHPKLADPSWMPGTLVASALVVGGWTYFIWTGSVATIWPMFGIANQLLAVVGLAVVTTILVNEGRARYAWVTVVPMLAVATTTLTAGWKSVVDNPNFWPATQAADAALRFKGWLNSVITVALMVAAVLIIGLAARRCLRLAPTARGAPRGIAERGA